MSKIYKSFFLLTFTFLSISMAMAIDEVKVNSTTPVVSNVKQFDVNPIKSEQVSNDASNPKPVQCVTNVHTEPTLNKDYIEKWSVNSARTLPDKGLDVFYMLSSSSFFTFYPNNKVVFKLNENYPIQTGYYTMGEYLVTITIDKEQNCSNCFSSFTITRKSLNDKEFVLSFDNMQQLFSVNVSK